MNKTEMELNSERKEYPLELIQLTSFPSTPAELPAEIYKHAYSDEEPTHVEMPGIATIADHKIPLKSSNKLLKAKDTLDSVKRQPSASPTRDDIKSEARGASESPGAA